MIATRADAPLASVLVWRYLFGALTLAVIAGGPRAVQLPARRAMRILLLGGAGQAAVAGLSL